MFIRLVPGWTATKETDTSTVIIAIAAILGLTGVAYVMGQFTTRSLETEIDVQAPASDVWTVLTTTIDYPDWNPFVRTVQGELRPGERPSVTIQPPGKSAMTFTPVVLVSIPDRELRWRGQLGLPGLFDGEHYFLLEETAPGVTRLTHGENFSGMLVLPILRMIRNSTAAGFDAMNSALKIRAECTQ